MSQYRVYIQLQICPGRENIRRVVRETGAHSLGGVLFFKDVCPAATIIPRILQGFHLPAFRAPFFILQPAQLETPEEKEKQVKIIIIIKKYKATFPLPSPSPPN